MEKIDDVLPYLNLRDGEEILFVKRFERKEDLLIKRLPEYYEPEKFPGHLITIKKDNYFFSQIDIITNFRLIKFGLNYIHMKQDGTPISEIFHHENLFLWVSLEDIMDYNVDFGEDIVGTMGFKFFGKGRLKVKERPLHFTGYNYEEYCQIKDIVVRWLKYEQQEIDEEEDKKIQKIIKRNKDLFNWVFIGLIIHGIILIIPLIIPSAANDFTVSFLYYSIIGLYVVYMLFFLLFNTIHIGIQRKKYKEKSFFTLMKINFAWYHGPAISGVIFILGFMIYMLELLLLNFIDNKWLALSISIGFWTITTILAVAFDLRSWKKKKRAKEAINKEV